MSNTSPRLHRKIAIILYDSLLLIGVLFVAALAFELITGYRGQGPLRVWFQVYCGGVVAAYFIGFWHAGQTLPMKAWRVRLTNASEGRLSWPLACARFALALLGWGLAGLSLWWSLFDRDGQYLHDRLLGTRLSQS